MNFNFQMRISYDDQYLFSVGDDGTLFTLKVADKDSRALKKERDTGYAEEVLITRSDLEEKVLDKDVHALYVTILYNVHSTNMYAADAWNKLA